MKKLLSIFLLLWLPLFSAAATAMDAQMQAMQMPASSMPAHADAVPCHDQASVDIAAQPCCGEHESDHDCFACGVCAFGQAGSHLTAIAAPAFPPPASATPGYPNQLFSSQLYPPALKPPISA